MDFGFGRRLFLLSPLVVGLAMAQGMGSAPIGLIAMLPSNAKDLVPQFVSGESQPKMQGDTLGLVYYPDGSIQRRIHFRNGKLDGLEEGFLPTGVLSYSRTYKNGVLQGAEVVYQSDGKGKSMELSWKEGHVDGNVAMYHDDGSLRVRMTYRSDTLNGVAETYWPGGKLLSQATYKNGRIHGPALHHTPEGEVFLRSLYFKGDCVRGCQTEPVIRN